MTNITEKKYIYDTHFQADVTLKIKPIKETNCTQLEVTVDYSPYSDNTSYVWYLDIDFYCTDIDLALQEIKKDFYTNVGSSETI